MRRKKMTEREKRVSDFIRTGIEIGLFEVRRLPSGPAFRLMTTSFISIPEEVMALASVSDEDVENSEKAKTAKVFTDLGVAPPEAKDAAEAASTEAKKAPKK